MRAIIWPVCEGDKMSTVLGETCMASPQSKNTGKSCCRGNKGHVTWK
jgi:hypothetical protein